LLNLYLQKTITITSSSKLEIVDFNFMVEKPSGSKIYIELTPESGYKPFMDKVQPFICQKSSTVSTTTTASTTSSATTSYPVAPPKCK
jgi:hypothetical protein